VHTGNELVTPDYIGTNSNVSTADREKIFKFIICTTKALVRKIGTRILERFADPVTSVSMEKQEREWVAMMLAELRFIGLGNISDHYRFVLTNMDELLEKEYQACVRTWKHVEKNGVGDGSSGSDR